MRQTHAQFFNTQMAVDLNDRQERRNIRNFPNGRRRCQLIKCKQNTRNMTDELRVQQASPPSQQKQTTQLLRAKF